MLRPLALLLLATAAAAQPVPDEVVFEDFDYASAAWQADDGLDPSHNAGSLFGWNDWRTSLNTSDSQPDRLWYRGYSWTEPFVPNELYGVLPESAVPGTGNGAAVLRAPAGYNGPDVNDHAQVEINTGFVAREGVWAARVNFTDLRDVRRMMQSFWAMSMATPIVRMPDGSMEKQRSEIDHELNNWFYVGWQAGGAGGADFEALHASDSGGVLDEAGYYEGGQIYLVPQVGPSGPDGVGTTENYHCTVVRNETTTYRPSPATCSALMTGQGPMLVYGIPMLEGDLAVDLLMMNAGGNTRFEVRAAWEALSPDGTETDRYLLRLASPPGSGAPGLSQPMSARFSQSVAAGGFGGVERNERPLLQSHDFVLDWFFFSPDASLDLEAIDRHVATIRGAGVRRLNTLGHPIHRPATTVGGQWRWDTPPTVHIHRAPERVAPGDTARFEGGYALRTGDLKVTWTLRERRLDGPIEPPTWVVRDAWLRQDILFPSADAALGRDGPPVRSVVVGLRVEEYAADAFLKNWEPMAGIRASRSVEYIWDGEAWACVSCASARDPRVVDTP